MAVMVRGHFILALAMLGAQLTTGSAAAAPASDRARVIERYGAAIREDSDPTAPALMNAACNDSYLIIGSNGPWKEVFSVVGVPDEESDTEENDVFGWILAEHTVIGEDPGPIDCGASPTYQAGRMVQSSTENGCMTLRSEASFGAGESDCRLDGTPYEVVNGPVGGGDEWYEVRPTSGGTNGWARGRELFPIP